METTMKIMGKIESLLFVSGEEGLSLDELTTLLGVKREKVFYSLLCLREKYQKDINSGIALVVINERYQLVTKAVYAPVIKQYAVSPFAKKLSQAALETLAIIAYRQPITRLEIDDIRGVQSASLIQKLEQRDLVEIKGKQQSPGRPNLYGVTTYFYQYFGLNSMAELPDLTELFSPTQTTQALFEITEEDRAEEE